MPDFNNINIFTHPTTTIFLDDDRTFFSELYFKIGKHIRCKYFDNPEQALNFSHLPFKNLSLSFPDEPPSNTPIHDALFNSHRPLDNRRFLEPSVFVVDYHMPEINGLDVCKKIVNPYIKKILLTGVADEKVAIKALNSGIIDYYVHKREENLSQIITSAVIRQQDKYLQNIIKNYPFYYKPPHVGDSIFGQYLFEICKRHNIIEYYFMDNPMGFLLINKQGKPFILLAYTNEEIEAHIDNCQSQSASSELLGQLTERRNIPFFYNSRHYLYEKTINDWTIYMHPVTQIDGQQPYFCSLIDNPQTKTLLKGFKDVILASYQTT